MQLYSTENKMRVRSFDYMGQFWRENEIQMFSAKETQLYFFLLAECRRRCWQVPFGCSTQRITNNLGISRQTLCRLRKKLQDRGLITYEEGKNNSSVPGYVLLIKPDCQTAQQNVTANGTQDGTASGTAEGTIINNIVRINKSTISKEKPLLLDELQTILQNDCEWLGNVKEYVKQHGMEVDDIKIQEMLGEFFLYLRTCGIQSKTPADAQQHFVNWLMKKGNNRGYRQKAHPAWQVGVKLTDDNPDKFKNTSEW